MPPRFSFSPFLRLRQDDTLRCQPLRQLFSARPGLITPLMPAELMRCEADSCSSRRRRPVSQSAALLSHAVIVCAASRLPDVAMLPPASPDAAAAAAYLMIRCRHGPPSQAAAVSIAEAPPVAPVMPQLPVLYGRCSPAAAAEDGVFADYGLLL